MTVVVILLLIVKERNSKSIKGNSNAIAIGTAKAITTITMMQEIVEAVVLGIALAEERNIVRGILVLVEIITATITVTFRVRLSKTSNSNNESS